MYYEAVFRELNKHKVRYLVIGGIAVNLYGIPRATADLDLMVEMTSENLKKLITAIEQLGYRPKVPVKALDFADPVKRKKWQAEKGMVVFNFFHPAKPFESIDIFVDNPIRFEIAEQNKKIVTAGEIKIPLISINHLIELKKVSGRKQDLSDIEHLQEIKKLLIEVD
ncbi:MAG: hypothetical protein QMD71_04150 [bacterium]|nr:hypothetical protein [bacterium]